jgi:pilus assembly protein Flp/PilA
MRGGRGFGLGRPRSPECLGSIHRESIMLKLKQLIRNNKGATAIEYGLIAALIAVAAITAMKSVGSTLNSTFSNVSTQMNG